MGESEGRHALNGCCREHRESEAQKHADLAFHDDVIDQIAGGNRKDKASALTDTDQEEAQQQEAAARPD